MSMLLRRTLAGCAGCALLFSTATSANDSQAALGLGGLIFERNNQVSMDSEDLYLSAEMVRVKYQYRNTGTKPVTLLIAFPLPTVPLETDDPDMVDASVPDWKQIAMKTLVNGKPVPLTRIDVPRVNGKDVSNRLKSLGWPVLYWESKTIKARLAALSADDKSELTAEGLLTTQGMAFNQVRPAWTVETSFARTQTFAPGVLVTVEHQYYPQTGGTVSSALDRSAREQGMAGPDGYAAKYCVDQAFLKGYDRRRYLPNGQEKPGLFVAEGWLKYILSTGANWKGPIKRFHLTVDKGLPDTLVSLCMDGLVKTGPTRFEVTKTNFEPRSDLEVLFVNITNGEGGQ